MNLRKDHLHIYDMSTMIWYCERMCGCAALLPLHIHSGMSAIAVWAVAAVVAAVCRGCVWASLCFVCCLYPFLLLGEFTLFVTTIFSIGCLGWDDDEGCSKV